MSKKPRLYRVEKPIDTLKCNNSYFNGILVIIDISDGTCESGFAVDGNIRVVDRKRKTKIHLTDDGRYIICRCDCPFDITHLM